MKIPKVNTVSMLSTNLEHYFGQGIVDRGRKCSRCKRNIEEYRVDHKEQEVPT